VPADAYGLVFCTVLGAPIGHRGAMNLWDGKT
jgi:hypothetical protein